MQIASVCVFFYSLILLARSRALQWEYYPGLWKGNTDIYPQVSLKGKRSWRTPSPGFCGPFHPQEWSCNPAFVLCGFRVRLTALWEVHFETRCTLRFFPYFRRVLPINVQLRTWSWRRLNPHSMWMYVRPNRRYFFSSVHVLSMRADITMCFHVEQTD